MPPPDANDSVRTASHVSTPDAESATETLAAEAVSAAKAGNLPPPAVPGYEIEGVLGRGGMGVVWKARHLALKRTVALKMI